MGLINFFRNYYAALRHRNLSSDGLLKIQQQRFKRLLTHAVKHSEFYQELYSGIDIEKCRLQDLPVVTKSAMMNNYDHFVTDKRIKLKKIQSWLSNYKNQKKLYLGEFLPLPTSGSSGGYTVVVYNRKTLDLLQASLFARHPLNAESSAYGSTKRLVSHLFGQKARIAIIGIPGGNLEHFVRSAPSFHRFFSDIKILSMFDPIDQIITTLNEFQPGSVITYSFYLAMLAQKQLEGQLNMTFGQPMSFLAGTGEPLTKNTNELAVKAWNFEVQDDYGAAECYFMATSCKNLGHLHAMSDLSILEVVDGNYNSVPKGKYGEKILITNLINLTQPIIRYEIDDITGYASESCKCGLPFPTLLPVQGRKSDFLFFEKPQGNYVRFHPYRFIIPLYYAHELQQYQIVQVTRNELTFLYVPQNKGSNIEQRLRQILEESLKQAGLESHVTLKLKQVGTIPRNERSGKFQIVKGLGAPSDLYTAPNRNT